MGNWFVRVCAFLLAATLSVQAIAQPTTAPATTQAIADPLFREIQKRIEAAQQAFRAARKPNKPLPAGKNSTSLQKQRATATMPSYFNFRDLAQELNGKTGLLTFQVGDVHDNKTTAPWFILTPSGVHEMKGKTAYLVVASFEVPTATYLTELDRARVKSANDRGQGDYADRILRDAATGKPHHELWLFSDDPQIPKWDKRSKHAAYIRVINAELHVVTGDYVKAILVAQIEPRPTTQPSP